MVIYRIRICSFLKVINQRENIYLANYFPMLDNWGLNRLWGFLFSQTLHLCPSRAMTTTGTWADRTLSCCARPTPTQHPPPSHGPRKSHCFHLHRRPTVKTASLSHCVFVTTEAISPFNDPL